MTMKHIFSIILGLMHSASYKPSRGQPTTATVLLPILCFTMNLPILT